MNTNNLRFRYVAVKHVVDIAIHEAFLDTIDNIVIAINGEPLTLYAFDIAEMKDIVGMIMKDIADGNVVEEDECERLYANFDNIVLGNFSSMDLEPNNPNVLTFTKKA